MTKKWDVYKKCCVPDCTTIRCNVNCAYCYDHLNQRQRMRRILMRIGAKRGKVSKGMYREFKHEFMLEWMQSLHGVSPERKRGYHGRLL
jgi:hypothetical protein